MKQCKALIQKNKKPLLAALLAAAFLLPLFSGSYVLGILCRILLYGTLAGSLNVVNGYSGQFNIGHAGFVCIGAYAGALCGTRLGWPLWYNCWRGARSRR